MKTKLQLYFNKYILFSEEDEKHLWSVDLLAHLLFILFSFLAIIFYKERMLAFDNAFYVFKMIHFQDFNIENGRWGAYPSQILPYLAIKSESTLQTIMKLYSLNVVLFHYVFFLLIRYILKDRWGAIVLCLSLVLCYRYTFYYTVSEVHLGFGPTVMLLSLINKFSNTWNNIKKGTWALLVMIIIIYITYCHMLFVFLVAFSFGWIWLLKKELRKDPFYYLGLLLGISWILFKILSIKEGSYDASKIPSLQVFLEQLPNLKNLPSYKFIEEYREIYYWPLKWVLLLGLVGLAMKKKFLPALAVSIFLILFSLLIVITYYKGESPVVQENYWILCGFIIALPFTEGALKNLKPILIATIVSIVFSFHLYKIWKAHFLFTQRNEYTERICNEIRKQNTTKGIIDERNIDWGKILTDWDMAFESLLLSSLNSPDSAITFYTASNINQYDSLNSNTDLFVSVDFAPLWFWNKDLNKKYFNLKTTAYKKLNTSQKGFDYNYFTKDSVEIIVPDKIEVTKFLTATIPVVIKNKTARSIFSTTDVEFPTYLSYHLLDENNNVIVADGKRSCFETDINPYSTAATGLLINLPDKRGIYKLKIDIITELKKWWYIDKEIVLEIK